MRKKNILIFLFLLILFSGCMTKQTLSSEENKQLDDFLVVLQDTFKDVGKWEVDKEKKVFYYISIESNLNTGLASALAGNDQVVEIWNNTTLPAFFQISEIISRKFPGFSMEFRNPFNIDELLAKIDGGIVKYNKFSTNLVSGTSTTSGVWPMAFISASLLALLISFSINSENRRIKKWRKINFPFISSFEFTKILLENCDTKKVYLCENIPYNRALYFTNGTDMNLEMDNVSPIFYNARPADNEMVFREYGFLVSSLGVIITKQTELKENSQIKEYSFKTSYLPFLEAYRFTTKNNVLTIFYADHTKESVLLDESEIEFFSLVFRNAINSGWTGHVNKIYEENRLTEDFETIIEDLNSAVAKATFRNKVDKENDQIAASSSGAILPLIRADLNQNQINDRFGGGQGHGHVGEQYGDVYDRILFRKTEKLGANHQKFGADRVVNGRYIQTKYHATAKKSIYSCFKPANDGGGAIYLSPDGSMQQIEVPKDQYTDGLWEIAKQIKMGNVPRENNPANAYKYVKKGPITYEQSLIATKSIFEKRSTINVRDSNGKIITREVTFGEKLVFSAGGDFITGSTSAFPIALVTSVWVFCNNVSNGVDELTALKNAGIAGIKPCLTGGLVYMFSSQFAGSNVGKGLGNIYVNNFTHIHISNKARTEAVTKGSSLVITAVITVGPDLTDCLRGRISVDQLVKNTVTSGAGMVSGALCGNALGSIIPGVGNVVGSVVGAYIGANAARQLLDFIEDDAVSMIRIAKEEFIETIMMMPLSKEEFQNILDKTFLNKDFSKLLKSMFAADDNRAFIHTYFLQLVEETYINRDLPNEEVLIDLAKLQYKDDPYNVMGF